MSTAVDATEHAEVPHHAHDGHQGHSDIFYVKVALVLAVLTGLELSTYYIHVGPLLVPLLLTLMAIKFFMVVWFFMHLRDDAKLFGRIFWTGVILAVAVYVVALATFQFFLK